MTCVAELFSLKKKSKTWRCPMSHTELSYLFKYSMCLCVWRIGGGGVQVTGQSRLFLSAFVQFCRCILRDLKNHFHVSLSLSFLAMFLFSLFLSLFFTSFFLTSFVSLSLSLPLCLLYSRDPALSGECG